jgi:hypothetical protein
MKMQESIIIIKWRMPVQITCFALFFLNCLPAVSQRLNVTTTQNLSFGAFSQGSSGGTITVSTSGTRTASGTVVPLNLGIQYFQAIFQVQDSTGTIVSILNGPDATLQGSNGGTMALHLSNSDPASPFISTIDPPGTTAISIGGTLTVGNADVTPPGNYTGTFYITFNNE